MKPKELELKIIRLIKSVRLEKNYKQINVAIALDISGGDYSKIENGKKALTITQLKIICDFFEISHLELFIKAECDDILQFKMDKMQAALIKHADSLEKNSEAMDAFINFVNRINSNGPHV